MRYGGVKSLQVTTLPADPRGMGFPSSGSIFPPGFGVHGMSTCQEVVVLTLMLQIPEIRRYEGTLNIATLRENPAKS